MGNKNSQTDSFDFVKSMRPRSWWLLGALYVFVFVGVCIYQRDKYNVLELIGGDHKMLPAIILAVFYIVFFVGLRVSAGFRRFIFRPSVDDAQIVDSLTIPLVLVAFAVVFVAFHEFLFALDSADS